MAELRDQAVRAANKNALKHGLYTRDAIAQRRQLRALIRQSRELLLKVGVSEELAGGASLRAAVS